jgi:hypothetical protein
VAVRRDLHRMFFARSYGVAPPVGPFLTFGADLDTFSALIQ